MSKNLNSPFMDSEALREFGKKWRAIHPSNTPCTLEELSRLTGFTRSQLNQYHESQLIPQLKEYSENRKQRPQIFYSPESVFKALIICEMRQAKFKNSQIATAIKNLEEMGFRFGPNNHLLTDGFNIHVATSEQRVVDIMRHNRQMLLLVSVEDQIDKLTGLVAQVVQA
ncbi:MAG: hypothetical protein LC794_13395 [Acidobacteria bacterium]|nr:hypothetical protein [Acidobacteriota bacterium]MCA1627666.1 hypothetical protein [Acidobacteriota bacterium]